YSDEPKGEILKQIQPTPGNEVVPSETTVIMEISAGPEMISLNNLKGMTEDEVKTYLNKHGLVYQRHYESYDDVPIVEVIKQDKEDKEKQEVKIYIEDEDHDIDDVYKETEIHKDKEFTIKFKLKSDEKGKYKVTRDDEEIMNKTVEAE